MDQGNEGFESFSLVYNQFFPLPAPGGFTVVLSPCVCRLKYIGWKWKAWSLQNFDGGWRTSTFRTFRYALANCGVCFQHVINEGLVLAKPIGPIYLVLHRYYLLYIFQFLATFASSLNRVNISTTNWYAFCKLKIFKFFLCLCILCGYFPSSFGIWGSQLALRKSHNQWCELLKHIF